MTVRVRLLAIIIFVAAVPLATSAWMALQVHQRAFNRKVEETQRLSARAGARLAQAFLDHTTGSLHLLADQIEWPRLSNEERQGALWLTYGQSNDFAAVALLDGAGAISGAPVFSQAGAQAVVPGHPELSRGEMAKLAELFAATSRTDAEVLVGAPAGIIGGAAPLLPVGIHLESPEGGRRWTLAVAVSLRGLCAEIAPGVGGAAGEVESLRFQLLDEERRALCPRPGDPPLTPVSPGLAAALGASTAEARGAQYLSPSGEPMQIASSRIARHPWLVIAETPLTVAQAPGRDIRRQALLAMAISLALAVGLGRLLAGQVTRPIRHLLEGVTALGEGRFDYRIAISGDDEFGRLARAFDEMITEVEDRDREVRAFSAELQHRVDERTRELKEAQAQLFQSKKMAAMAALGAGVAHEINNPLTSLLGLVQVLARRRHKDAASDDVALLSQVESDAVRIVGIVENLRSLAREDVGENATPLEVTSLIDRALAPLRESANRQGVRIVCKIDSPLPCVAGEAPELVRAFHEVCKNAVAAMPEGGLLDVSASVIDRAAVVVRISDGGAGIAPEHVDKVFDAFFTTKTQGTGKGLGLTVANAIILRHHGQIKISSAPGVGTTVRITLPAHAEAHLV